MSKERGYTMSIKRDLIGKRFGKLVVVEKLKLNNHKETEWLCLCDCGNEYVSTSNRLTSGKTTQCRACSFKQMAKKQTIHGCEPVKLWRTYQNMKTRCNNENSLDFKRYGERGIKVCDEWLGKYGFTNFAKWAFENGYSEEKGENGKTILTLDRIDVNGDYTPSNCRWVTNQEQQNNKRDNVFLEFNGKKQTIKKIELLVFPKKLLSINYLMMP